MVKPITYRDCPPKRNDPSVIPASAPKRKNKAYCMFTLKSQSLLKGRVIMKKSDDVIEQPVLYM